MKRFLSLALGIAMAAVSSWGQPGGDMPGSFGPPEKLNTALTRLFGNIQAFTAKAQLKHTEKGKKPVEMTMDMALDQGKLRTEVDLTTMKGGDMNAEMIGAVKQMGFEKIVMIARPDKSTSLMIYPGLKAYIEQTLPKESAVEKSPKIESTPQGKETIDGHACVKNKVVMTEANGSKFEALVWNATDLKDFPVQMQFDEKGDKFQLRYANVKLGSPEASTFEVPGGYVKHADMQALMAVVMQKMLGGAGGFK